jgi:hypothetical protein
VEEEEDDAEEDDDDDEEDPRKSRDRESKGRIGMMGFQRLGKKTPRESRDRKQRKNWDDGFSTTWEEEEEEVALSQLKK